MNHDFVYADFHKEVYMQVHPNRNTKYAQVCKLQNLYMTSNEKVKSGMLVFHILLILNGYKQSLPDHLLFLRFSSVNDYCFSYIYC